MNAIEGRLDPEKFFRIHRSRIVNMERIQEMQPWLNGEYAVLLRNGTRLTLSRGYREKLQERLARPVSVPEPSSAAKDVTPNCGAPRKPSQNHKAELGIR